MFAVQHSAIRFYMGRARQYADTQAKARKFSTRKGAEAFARKLNKDEALGEWLVVEFETPNHFREI